MEESNSFHSKSPNGQINGMATSNPGASATITKETAVNNENIANQSTGTGAVKKKTNMRNKSKTFHNGRPNYWNSKRGPPHHKFRNKSDTERMPNNDFQTFSHPLPLQTYGQFQSYSNSEGNTSMYDNVGYCSGANYSNYYKFCGNYVTSYNGYNEATNFYEGGNSGFYAGEFNNSTFRSRKTRNGSHNSETASDISNQAVYGEIADPNLSSNTFENNYGYKSNTNGNYKTRNPRYNGNAAYQDSSASMSKNGQYKSSKFRGSQFQNYEPKSGGDYETKYESGGSFKTTDKSVKLRKNGSNNKKIVEYANQRERLQAMMKQMTLECLVCCELIKHNNAVWSCKQCYHILHLKCVQNWAKSSKVENGWRCPACQNVCKDIPSDYYCFCGRFMKPQYIPGLIPHSCAEVCRKDTRGCGHICTILCHPGPCPDCHILVYKSCGCGKTKQQMMCATDREVICSDKCDKLLQCNIHKCQSRCHSGECEPCTEIVHQTCFCGKNSRDVTCTSELGGDDKYFCEDVCDRTLSCGNHKCVEKCHRGPCKQCSRDCNLVKTCFCGKKLLDTPRTSCLDPIPSCGMLCQKVLKCGSKTAPHFCELVCHEGNCPPCSLTTVFRCRCGAVNKEVACAKLVSDDQKCERKCNKRRLCGKHKCNQRCCIEVEHICPLPCNRTLTCGKHKCELTCHAGRCKPCIETSFEELHCECGSTVMYPPIPCGTRPPACDKPCSRQRECGHEPNHACHTGPCPPCIVLCKRWCFGKHEERRAIPCHQEEFSCGLPCSKPKPCGRHKCNSPCHSGPCPSPCKQPCAVERSGCGHPCLVPCHEPPCPKTTCKGKVAVSCVCGVQKAVRSCSEVTNDIRNLELAHLSEKMINMLKNQTVDISEINTKPERPSVFKILECTEECRVIERNRRLAIGLQIRNPDLSQKLTPRYSDFMKGWGKKDPHFCQKIHQKLTDLVQLAKQSQQDSRSFSFETMKRDKRQFVHEYCEHFGCESEAYDSEPNRNVVATAFRDKSWLPSMSLIEVIQRESGQRKVPIPTNLERNSNFKTESLTSQFLNRNNRLSEATNCVENSKKW